MTIAEWTAPLTKKIVRPTQISHKNFVVRHKQPGLDLKSAGNKNKAIQSIIRAAAEKVTLLQESQLKMQKIIEENIGSRSRQMDPNFITPPKAGSFRALSTISDTLDSEEPTPNTARGIELVNNLLARSSVADFETSTDQPLSLLTVEKQGTYNENIEQTISSVSSGVIDTNELAREPIKNLHESELNLKVEMIDTKKSSQCDDIEEVDQGGDAGDGRVEGKKAEPLSIDPLDAAIVSSFGLNDVRDGFSVGVIHELMGPIIHPHEVEAARRGLIDSYRSGSTDITRRLFESATGYVFWKFKAWLLIVNRTEEKIDNEDSVLYLSAQHMSNMVGLTGNSEEVEEVPEWIGLEILNQFKEGRDKIANKLIADIAAMGDPIDKGFEFDEAAMGGGCTLRIRGNVPFIPDEGDDHTARARLMIENSKLWISIIGRPRNPIRECTLMPDFVLGGERGGEHRTKRSGEETYFLPMEIVANMNEYRTKGGILVEYEEVENMRYKVDHSGLEEVMDRFYDKVSYLSKQKRWAKSKPPESALKNLQTSIDETFQAKYCLVSGMLSKYLAGGKINEVGISKISLVVKGGAEGWDPGMLPNEATRLREGRNKVIRPRDFQWGRIKHDRLCFLIELERQVEVGTKMQGGRQVYSRICVSSNEEMQRGGIVGEWITRQYLRSDEAEFFGKVQKQQDNCGVDSVIAAVRGLTRVLEIDNGLLREVKKHFEETMGSEVCVQVYSYPHSDQVFASPYLDELSDEPILIVNMIKSEGGERIRRAYGRQHGSRELKIGSIILNIFMELDEIYTRPLVPSGRIIDIDSRNLGDDARMGDVIGALGLSYERVHMLVRVSSLRWKGRWYGILKKEWGGETRYDSRLTVKERAIPRFNTRTEALSKGLDAFNIEPVEHHAPSMMRTSQNYKAGGGKESGKIIKSYGIPPGPHNQGFGGRSRSRSRSRSRESRVTGDQSERMNLKSLYKDQTFDLLKSPKEAETRIRADSPSTRLQEFQKREGESRPQVQKIYGINKQQGPILSQLTTQVHAGMSSAGNGGKGDSTLNTK